MHARVCTHGACAPPPATACASPPFGHGLCITPLPAAHARASHAVRRRYTLSLERKEATERRSKRKERMAAFRQLLEASGLNSRSQWRRVQSQLEGEAAFRALDKIDRLAVCARLTEP